MYLALDALGQAFLQPKGATGSCPRSLRQVHAKCGETKIHHWAHEKGKNDCDPWAESETKWHRDWQMRAEPEWCEVVMGELREHRADIRRPDDGLVIELQHSYIKQEEVREREVFYGNMWWVFNTEPWRFRATVGVDGNAKFRWMSRRRTLDAAKHPIYLDLGGPLLRVTGYGPQGCLSGSGELLPRTEFIKQVGLRAQSEDEVRQTSHYSLLQKDGETLLFRSLEEVRTWESQDGTAMHHDLAGRSTVVKIPEIPLVRFQSRPS